MPAEPIDGSDAFRRHVSCGAGSAPSLARINSTFGMTTHPYLFDCVANLVTIFGGMCMAGYLSLRCKIETSTATWIAISVLTAFMFAEAILCHVSFVLIDFNGGIPWYRPYRMLVISLAALAVAAFFFVRSLYVSPSKKNTKMPNQSTDPTP